MPGYAHYHSQLEALIERLRVYLDRLEERAREFGAEAVTTATELQATDPGSVPDFRAEVSRPVMFLHAKAERILDQYFAPFEDLAGDSALTREERDALGDLCEAAGAMVGDFGSRLEGIVEGVFTRGQEGRLEREWEKAIGDWRLAQSSFSCSHCGARVLLPELYHVAVYVTCQGCGSRVTFRPSPSMRGAPALAEKMADRQVAEERRRYEEQREEESGPGMELVHYAYYRLAWLRRLTSLLPFYARTRRDDVLGEICSRFLPEGGGGSAHPRGPRYAEVEYVNIIGSFGDFAAVLRHRGLTDHLGLLLIVVRAVMRPGDELAQGVLDGTYSEAAYRQRADTALRLPESYPG